MAFQETPGAKFVEDLEGEYIKMNFHPQDEKEGDAQYEKFRVNTFKVTNKDFTVALYSKKRGLLFKWKWCDHKEIIPNHQLSLDVLSDTLKQALLENANVWPSVVMSNDVMVLEIRVREETLLFGKTVTYDFNYRLPVAKLPRVEYVDMRFGELEKDLASLMKENEAKKKNLVVAKFEIKDNNYTTLEEENGSVILHSNGNGSWNTTPLDFDMTGEEAFRARFRVISHFSINMQFGIVSASFNLWRSRPTQANQNGWQVNFNGGGAVGSLYSHNGSSSSYGGGIFGGSIITVEFFPQLKEIHYLINDTPLAKHYNCTFAGNSFAFAVSLYNVGSKVKLLGVDRIQETF